MANNIVTKNDINQTASNPFEWNGAVKPGKPWILPNASDLPSLPNGTGYGCFVG
jgi:hypothetical protein